MGLIINKSVPFFDLTAVSRGDLIRVRRATDTVARNGVVTRVDDREMHILWSNIQNNQTSNMVVTAADVSIGVWEIWWSSDMATINYQAPVGTSDV